MAIKKNQKVFEMEVFNLTDGEYQVLSNYSNAKTKVVVRHSNCGNEYQVTPTDFLRGRRCPQCASISRASKRQKSNEEFTKEVVVQVGTEYTFLEEYTSVMKKLKVKHNKCGFEYEVTPSDFLNNKRRCPQCAWASRSSKRRKTAEEFKKEVCDLVGIEYSVIGEYTAFHNPVKFKHNECGNEFSVLASNFLNLRSGCPVCSSSKGEKAVAAFLSDNGIEYKQQFRFKDCRNKRSLPFDFALFKDGELSMLVEYDGEFHFKPRFGIEAFKVVVENDKIKNRYCKDKGIKLLRIPYTRFQDIESILEKEIL